MQTFLDILPLFLSVTAFILALSARLAIQRFVNRYNEPFQKNQKLMEEINTYLERVRTDNLRPPTRGEMDQLSVEMVEKMLIQGMTEEEAKRSVLEKYQRFQFDLEDH